MANHGIEQLQKNVVLAGADTAARLAQWFAARWLQRQAIRVSNLSVPSEGISNAMLIFDVDWVEAGHAQQGRFVARLEADDEPVAPKFSDRHASSVSLEFTVHGLVAQHSRCPVAPLVGLETSDAVLGRPFYVMGHVIGRVPPSQGPNVDSFIVHEATPAQRRQMIENGLDALVALHRVDHRALGLQWLDPSDGGAYTLAPQIEAYRALSLRHLRGVSHPLLIEALDWLREHEPAQLQPALVWGDSRPGNILFGADYRVAAALDWELAAIMPRDSDIALWLVTDYMVHESEGVARLPGYPTRDEQLAHYERQIGTPVRDLLYWEIFTAMKVAYVFVRVVRRMQDRGVMPAGVDDLIFDNFATRYLRDNLGRHASALVGAR